MATQLVTKSCDLGSLGVLGLASMVGGQTSWLARMFGLYRDDVILAEANILAYPTVCSMRSKGANGQENIYINKRHIENTQKAEF